LSCRRRPEVKFELGDWLLLLEKFLDSVNVFAWKAAVFVVEAVTAPFAVKQCNAVSAFAALGSNVKTGWVDLFDVLGVNHVALLLST
jgi:hypothetical protein